MISILKVAMLSLGILLGTLFADFWSDVIPVVWAVFALTGVASLSIGIRSLMYPGETS